MRTPRAIAAAVLGAALTLPLMAGSPAGADDREGGDGSRIAAAPADRIALAAGRYGLTSDELREQLAADETMRLAANGLLYYVDPAPAEPPSGRPSAEGLTAHAPLGQTFELHSNPGSQRTVFLDFDGHDVADTGWNPPYGELANGSHPAWDPWFDGDAFSDEELLMVQDVWQRVAEDYAPFDVDVTTEEPAAAAIDRSGPGDQVYGTRALITPSDTGLEDICGGDCGGIAFIEAFDMYLGKDPVWPDDYHALLQPAWVFTQTMGDDPKSIAEAVTHEVGHNLGLEHDGTTSEGYYTGHDGWAPIMGVGYEQPIVQWSLNDYPGAKLGGPGEGAGELQDSPDDIVAMGGHGALQRADDAANAHGSARAVPSTPTTGIISSRTDVDVFALGSCTGNVSVAADPAGVSPNLDIKLDLLNASGGVVDSDDPESGWDIWDYDVATGLDASVSTSGASGNYYVRVDGVGRLAPGNGSGYTDYGSLGVYTLDVTASCTAPEEPTEDAPSAPLGLAGSHLGDGTVRLTWQAPADDGGSAVTAYRVYQDGSLVDELPAGARSADIDGVSPGSHSFAVSAVNEAGEGAQASTNVTVEGDEPTEDVPGAVTFGKPKPGKNGKPYTAVVGWTAPAADPEVSGFEAVLYRKTSAGWVEDDRAELDPSVTAVKITNKKKRATIRVEVRACNSIGCGDWAASSAVRLR